MKRFLSALTGAIAALSLSLSPLPARAQVYSKLVPTVPIKDARVEDFLKSFTFEGEEAVLTTDYNKDGTLEKIILDEKLEKVLSVREYGHVLSGKTTREIAEGKVLKPQDVDRYHLFKGKGPDYFVLQYPITATTADFSAVLSGPFDSANLFFGDGYTAYTFDPTTLTIKALKKIEDDEQYQENVRSVSAEKTSIIMKAITLRDDNEAAKIEEARKRVEAQKKVLENELKTAPFIPYPLTLTLYDAEPNYPGDELVITSMIGKDKKTARVILTKGLEDIIRVEGFDDPILLPLSGTTLNLVALLLQGNTPYLLALKKASDPTHYQAVLLGFTPENRAHYVTINNIPYEIPYVAGQGFAFIESDEPELTGQDQDKRRNHYAPQLATLPVTRKRITKGGVCSYYLPPREHPALERIASHVQDSFSDFEQVYRTEAQRQSTSGSMQFLVILNNKGELYYPGLERSVRLVNDTTKNRALIEDVRARLGVTPYPLGTPPWGFVIAGPNVRVDDAGICAVYEFTFTDQRKKKGL